MNATTAPYTFHAFEVSYFSAKVRPALRYKKLWYEEVRADYGEIQRRTGMAFIPMLVTPQDETWQDSSDIYARLEERHPNPPLFPTTPLQRVAADLVNLYTDEYALMPAMHYRWGSELGESSARARFAAMTGSRELGDFAADRMVKARGFLGATDESGPAIEAHTLDLLDALSAHFEAGHAYLLGGRMSFADCALMGCVYGHFFNDLVSRRLLLERAPAVCGWIERCQSPGADGQTAWLDDDELAPTLVEVLGVMGTDAAPAIKAMVEAIESWADATPAKDSDADNAKVPRVIGTASFELRGTPIERAAMPYTLLSVERARKAFAGLPPDAQARISTTLGDTGWEPVLDHHPRHRIIKNGFELARA